MSVTDLNILTDAVTFAIVACLGVVFVYAAVRAALKHRSGSTALKIGLPAAALLVILLAGAAMWPATGTIDSAVDASPTPTPTASDASTSSALAGGQLSGPVAAGADF